MLKRLVGKGYHLTDKALRKSFDVFMPPRGMKNHEEHEAPFRAARRRLTCLNRCSRAQPVSTCDVPEERGCGAFANLGFRGFIPWPPEASFFRLKKTKTGRGKGPFPFFYGRTEKKRGPHRKGDNGPTFPDHAWAALFTEAAPCALFSLLERICPDLRRAR